MSLYYHTIILHDKVWNGSLIRPLNQENLHISVYVGVLHSGNTMTIIMIFLLWRQMGLWRKMGMGWMG